MNKSKVIEVAYKTIKDSFEWGLDRDAGNDFAQYIDGVVDMTDALLEEVDKPIYPCDRGEENNGR